MLTVNEAPGRPVGIGPSIPDSEGAVKPETYYKQGNRMYDL